MDESEWWLERMDELKARLGLTDVGLGRQLDITGVMVGHVRGGRSALPTTARIRLLDKLGYTITREALLLLLPEAQRELVRAADNHRAAEAKDGRKPKAPPIPKHLV